MAIYTVANHSFARLFSSTSERARRLGYSIRYDEMEELNDMLKSRKVYINRSHTAEYPLLANGIFEGDEMQLIVMVWGIPWERMNLGLANLLTIIGYLIQNAVLRANRYQKALENERLLDGTRILEKDAFTALVRAYLKAQDKGLTVCSILSIETTKEELKKEGEKVAKLLRSTDYLGVLEDDRLYILLSNTNKKGADVVSERFREIGYDAIYQEDVLVS